MHEEDRGCQKTNRSRPNERTCRRTLTALTLSLSACGTSCSHSSLAKKMCTKPCSAQSTRQYSYHSMDSRRRDAPSRSSSARSRSPSARQTRSPSPSPPAHWPLARLVTSTPVKRLHEPVCLRNFERLGEQAHRSWAAGFPPAVSAPLRAACGATRPAQPASGTAATGPASHSIDIVSLAVSASWWERRIAP